MIRYMPEYSSDLDGVFHALSDPTRRAVIQRLSAGPASVSELAKPHAMALQSFSQHLRVLEDSGLVRSTKTGRVRTCELANEALTPAEQWIAEQRRVWTDHFARLDAYLEELQHKDQQE